MHSTIHPHPPDAGESVVGHGQDTNTSLTLCPYIVNIPKLTAKNKKNNKKITLWCKKIIIINKDKN